MQGREWGYYKAAWPSVKNKQRCSSKISHSWTLQEFREECQHRARQKCNIKSPHMARGLKVQWKNWALGDTAEFCNWPKGICAWGFVTSRFFPQNCWYFTVFLTKCSEFACPLLSQLLQGAGAGSIQCRQTQYTREQILSCSRSSLAVIVPWNTVRLSV